MGLKRTVIVGNSAAALSAVEAFRRHDANSPLTIISDEALPAYSRLLTPYFIADRIGEKSLFFKDEDYYRRLGANALFGKRVVSISPEKGTLSLDTGEEAPFDLLFLATGSSATLPDIEGIKSPGIFTLRDLKDAQAIKAYARRAKRVAFLGAGLVCLHVLEALWDGSKEMFLVVKSPHVLSQILDEEGARLVENELRGRGVHLHFGREVKRIEPLSKRVKGLLLDDGTSLEVDMVVVGKGVRPRLDCLEGSTIKASEGIEVDRYLRTNFPHIYAGGDVAFAHDLLTGERVLRGLWPVAVEQGKLAGLNMAGKDLSYEGSLRTNITELFGLTIASIGWVEEGDGVFSQHHMDIEGKVFRKVLFKDSRLMGCILIGKTREAGILKHWIVRGGKAPFLEKGLSPSHPLFSIKM